MYYKPDLKYKYYYFRIYSNKYYSLLKKKMLILHWLYVSNVRCFLETYRAKL